VLKDNKRDISNTTTLLVIKVPTVKAHGRCLEWGRLRWAVWGRGSGNSGGEIEGKGASGEILVVVEYTFDKISVCVAELEMGGRG